MDTPAPENLPEEGYHWATTQRREKRHQRAEILYVHRRGEGVCDLYAIDRALPLTWDEIHSWGAPVEPGPTTGNIAKIEAYAPVRLSEQDRADGYDFPLVRQIPESLHLEVHAAWAKHHDSPRSAEDVARKGGFTFEQIGEFGPEGWIEAIEPRSPGSHFPGPEENEALALMNIIKDRLVEIEQHKYSEVFDGEAVALRSYGDKVARLMSQGKCPPAGAADGAQAKFDLWCVDTGVADSESRYYIAGQSESSALELLNDIRSEEDSPVPETARIRRCRRVSVTELQPTLTETLGDSIREAVSALVLPGANVPEETWAVWDDEMAVVDETMLSEQLPQLLKVEAFVCDTTWSQGGFAAYLTEYPDEGLVGPYETRSEAIDAGNRMAPRGESSVRPLSPDQCLELETSEREAAAQ
ncbi:MAG: hypothetical protein ACRBN8_19850 [Nannocystales bacterium]